MQDLSLAVCKTIQPSRKIFRRGQLFIESRSQVAKYLCFGLAACQPKGDQNNHPGCCDKKPTGFLPKILDYCCFYLGVLVEKDFHT